MRALVEVNAHWAVAVLLVGLVASASCPGPDPEAARIALLYANYETADTKPTDVWCGNLPLRRGARCMSRATHRGGQLPARLVEVRGRVAHMPYYACADPPDETECENEVVFNVKLDWGWEPASSVAAVATPLNTPEAINRAITPHNIVSFGRNATGGGDARLGNNAWGGPWGAIIHVEINGWGPTDSAERARRLPGPEGWVTSRGVPAGFESVVWAFDPYFPPSVVPGKRLSTGDYVRIVGTLWEDAPHLNEEGPAGGPGGDAKECWFQGRNALGEEGRGWAEIHAVDYLAILEEPPEHEDEFEILAVCGDGRISREVRPRGSRPSPYAVVDYEEWIDTQFSYGRSYNQDRVQVLGDRIRIEVEVGDGDPRGKEFKAAYRVFWTR